jgi:hypothetical protein
MFEILMELNLFVFGIICIQVFSGGMEYFSVRMDISHENTMHPKLRIFCEIEEAYTVKR